jgi:polysaccharide export outer membrane protein
LETDVKDMGLAVFALACGALFAGCSNQDFGRPVARLTDVLDSGAPYVESKEEETAKLRAQQLGKMLLDWERSRTVTDADYILGVDDVIEVSILSLDKPDEVSKLSRSLRRDGTISLPLIGDVKAGGITVRDLESSLRKAFEGRFIKNPELTVKVTEYNSLPVVITGAVTRPGVYYLRRNESSVLEVLSMAEGLASTAGSRLLIVRGKKQSGHESAAPGAGSTVKPAEEPVHDAAPLPFVSDPPDSPAGADEGPELQAMMIEVDLDRLVTEGDIRLNVTIIGGDVVTVAPRKKAYIYVLGYVQSPGAFEISDSSRIDALQAVARAGGLSGAARAENSFLVTERTGARRIIEIDITKMARGIRPPVLMLPGDTLVVGSGFMAKLAEFIKPSVGIGASLAPVP